MENIVYFFPVMGILALLFVMWRSAWVSKQEVGTEKMATIASHISKGAMAFLKPNIKFWLFLSLHSDSCWPLKDHLKYTLMRLVALSFVVGAFCSGLAGFLGMKVATKANVRTTNAARTSFGKALEVAFAGGSVMGLGVVGLGILGLSLLFILYSNHIWGGF